MTMRTIVRLFSVTLLSLGLILMSGCASTEKVADNSLLATQAIAEAKDAHAKAKFVNNDWRDTGALIASAEAKLKAGDYDESIRLANEARDQANAALAQAEAEKKKFLNEHAVTPEIDISNVIDEQAVPAGRVSSYSVVSGDNLWNISAKDEVYADPFQWPLIYKTNRDQIQDADLIHPGQVLDIDQHSSASEIDAAVNHAKTRGAWSLGDTEQSDREFLSK